MTPLQAFQKMRELCEEYHLKFSNVKPQTVEGYPIDNIEQALLKYEKLCKVINNFYEMVYGIDGVRYKFDSQTLAYFSYKLKQLIDNPSEVTEDE